MNNNDLFKRLHSESENIRPGKKINPENIEDILVGVKKKNNKGIITACISLCIIGVGILTAFSTGFFNFEPKQEIIDKNILSAYYEVNECNGDYSEIYKTVDKIVKYSETEEDYGCFDYEVSDSPALKKESSTQFNLPPVDEESDYSSTNVQVEGIDEADVVKTDGKYIYSVSGSDINITRANKGKLKFITSLRLTSDLIDLYVNNNKLIAILSDEFDTLSEASSDEATFNTYSNNEIELTKILIYDLSNINKPELISELTQSGYNISSRMIDNVIYLTTYQNIWDYGCIDRNNPYTYCPLYGKRDKLNCVKAKDIIINKKADNCEYLNVSTIDLNNPDDFSDMHSVLGGGSNIYASYNYLYVESYDFSWYEDDASTKIYRFNIDGTSIRSDGIIKLDGYVLNQFSMDENNGYFRVLHETYEDDYNTATLSIFDENFKLVSSLKNPVGNEEIQSVRFDGDIVYFVTFENTDPLFTVDISNPKEPEVLSELKITGFSEYLHPFGDNLLLGFGREVNPKTDDDIGLKLSMFDVSDKTNVTETAKKIFAKCVEKGDYDEINYYYSYADSDAEYNHKAIYVDTENCIIGIPYTNYIEDYYNYYDEYLYAIFKYDKAKKEFIEVTTINLKNFTSKHKEGYIDYTRGVRIDDYFYIVTNDRINSYRYDTFKIFLVEKMVNKSGSLLQ